MLDPRCQYCSSHNLVSHSEGETCLNCSRLQSSLPSNSEEIRGWRDEDEQASCLHELDYMEDRSLLTPDVRRYSERLFRILRQRNINFDLYTLLAIVIHQAMANIVGAVYSNSQLRSVLDGNFSSDVSTFNRYIRLWQSHGDLIITPPFFCRPYVPLHLIIQRPDQRREIFRKAIQLHINMKFLVPLPTCVYFVLKNSLSSIFDDELVNFICNFPRKSHLKKISSCKEL